MKRIITLALALIMTISCCLGVTSTVSAADVSARASLTLSDYNAILRAGNNSGQIKIGYTVTASKPADSVGVSSIIVYKSNGSKVTTITGTTANGLITDSSSSHEGTYTYSGTSGIYYYAEVTVFAKVGTISDSRTITTPTVKAR